MIEWTVTKSSSLERHSAVVCGFDVHVDKIHIGWMWSARRLFGRNMNSADSVFGTLEAAKRDCADKLLPIVRAEVRDLEEMAPKRKRSSRLDRLRGYTKKKKPTEEKL